MSRPLVPYRGRAAKHRWTQPSNSYILGTMDMPPFYSGNLLLAMPGLGDPNFEKSVIALCAHADNDAMGINIGQELPGLSLRELLTPFDTSGATRPVVPSPPRRPPQPHPSFSPHP